MWSRHVPAFESLQQADMKRKCHGTTRVIFFEFLLFLVHFFSWRRSFLALRWGVCFQHLEDQRVLTNPVMSGCRESLSTHLPTYMPNVPLQVRTFTLYCSGRSNARIGRKKNRRVENVPCSWSWQAFKVKVVSMPQR